MERQYINTDNRLVSIINGGKRFLSAKDPEGLLQGAAPVSLALDFPAGNWRLNLVFPNGTIAALSGRCDNGKYLITAIHLLYNEGRWEEITLPNKETTLIRAIGDLSKVPVRLKRHLSREVKIRAIADETESNPAPFLKDAFAAAFFKVEGGETKKTQDLFRHWRFNYFLTEQGENVRTEILGKYRTESAVITVSVETDIYGIGNKKVMLVRKVGAGRTAVIECKKNNGKNDIPSLTLAFDLDGKLNDIYPPTQQTEQKKIPKPSRTKK